MNWRIGAPVFSSDHSNKAGTRGRIYTPRIVVCVPRADGTRSREILEVVRAGSSSVDCDTETQEEERDICDARIVLHNDAV